MLLHEVHATFHQLAAEAHVPSGRRCHAAGPEYVAIVSPSKTLKQPLNTIAATAWSTLSATLWMRHDGLANKRALLAYPILLYFYFFIAVASGV